LCAAEATAAPAPAAACWRRACLHEACAGRVQPWHTFSNCRRVTLAAADWLCQGVKWFKAVAAAASA
jgi:hypothetical protein